MTAKHFYNLAAHEGFFEAARMARYLGVTLAQVQLWIRLLHRDTVKAWQARNSL
jgi:hypothetical protein